MKIIFGTDGWRGLLDSEVNESSIELVAQAFADYSLQQNASPKIAVAFDGRKNSKLFAEIFSQVLSGNSILVHLSDSITPTPALSFYVKKNNFSSGVMITASHNPAKYNGIKFKAEYGGPFFTEQTLRVEELLGKYSIKKNKLNIYEVNFFSHYEDEITRLINFGLIKNLKISPLVDSMGGAGSNLIQNILRHNDIPAETIYAPPSETFYNRFAEPIEKNLFPLKEALHRGQYCIGIANDGDADRIGLMNETGKWIGAQETILMIADYLFTQKKFYGDIVKTSSVTNKLKLFFENETRRVIDAQVGFKYIAEEMLKSNVTFGCEESGGFGYGFHIPERDGIFTAFLFLEMLAAHGFERMSQLSSAMKEKYGDIYYSRLDVENHSADSLNKLEAIFKDRLHNISGWKINDVKYFLSSRGTINGLKFYLEGGSRWLLIRVSETEPIVRFYAEANNEHEVKLLLNDGKRIFIT